MRKSGDELRTTAVVKKIEVSLQTRFVETHGDRADVPVGSWRSDFWVGGLVRLLHRQLGTLKANLAMRAVAKRFID